MPLYQPIQEHGPLTPDMQEAINAYLGAGGAEPIPPGASPAAEEYWRVEPLFLNAKLRAGDPLDPNERAVATQLQSCINLGRTRRPMTMYRGVHGDAADYIASLPLGSLVEDFGFFSTATSPDLADEFASEDGARLEIRVPADLPAAHIINSGEDFSEILLAPGTSFKLTAIHKQGSLRIISGAWSPAIPIPIPTAPSLPRSL